MKKTINKKEVKAINAKKFFDPISGTYIFPFESFCQNLGIIQWLIEFHPMKKNRNERSRRIGKIWIWAKQTRDVRYAQKIFEIETWAESFTTDSTLRPHNCFLPWRMNFCDVHKGSFIIDAYPRTEHKNLVIDATSSISITANFQ